MVRWLLRAQLRRTEAICIMKVSCRLKKWMIPSLEERTFSGWKVLRTCNQCTSELFCMLRLFHSYTLKNSMRSESCIINQNRSSLIQWQLREISLFTELLNADPEALCPPTIRQLAFAKRPQRSGRGRVSGMSQRCPGSPCCTCEHNCFFSK